MHRYLIPSPHFKRQGPMDQYIPLIPKHSFSTSTITSTTTSINHRFEKRCRWSKFNRIRSDKEKNPPPPSHPPSHLRRERYGSIPSIPNIVGDHVSNYLPSRVVVVVVVATTIPLLSNSPYPQSIHPSIYPIHNHDLHEKSHHTPHTTHHDNMT